MQWRKDSDGKMSLGVSLASGPRHNNPNFIEVAFFLLGPMYASSQIWCLSVSLDRFQTPDLENVVPDD